jgi:hypothetical protein
VAVTPLLLLNSGAAKLKTMGVEKKDGEASSALSPAMLLDVGGGAVSRACGCFMRLLVNTLTSKVTLFCVNFLLLAIALSVLMLGARMAALPMPSNELIDMTYVAMIMCCAGVLVVVSFLGCGGAWSGRRTYLAPYSAILLATLLLQVVAICVAWGMLGTGEAQEMARAKVERAYVLNRCATPTLDPPPYNVSCAGRVSSEYGTANTGGWLSAMVQSHCQYAGARDVSRLQAETVVALGELQFSRVSALATELTTTLATMQRIDSCLAKHNATISSPTGTGMYCVCATVISTNMALLKDLAYIAIACVVLQFLLLSMAVHLLLKAPPLELVALLGDIVSPTDVTAESAKRMVV